MVTKERLQEIRKVIDGQTFEEGEISPEGMFPDIIKRLVTGYVITKDGEFIGSRPVFQHYFDESPEEYETSLNVKTKILGITPVPGLIFGVFGIIPAHGTTLKQVETNCIEFDGTSPLLGFEYADRPHENWVGKLKEKWVQRIAESEK